MMKFKALRKMLESGARPTKDQRADAVDALDRKVALYDVQRAILTRKMFAEKKTLRSSGQEGKPGVMLRYIRSAKPTQLMAVLEKDAAAIQFVTAILAGKEPPKVEPVAA